MTREQVMKLFPEATDEQVTGILNAHHAELQTEKKTLEELKAKAGEAKTLEEQLAEAKRLAAEAEKQKEEAENKNLSEVDLLKKELEKRQSASDQKIAELTAKLATSEISAYAASKNLVGDHMGNILKAFGGDIQLAKTAIDSIFALKDEWSAAAALAKEQDIAAKSGNPGGNPGGGSDTQSIAEAKAKERAARKSGGVNNEVIELYRR